MKLKNKMKKEMDIIWLESILKATPEALQHIADNKSVAQNLRDAFPHPYTLDDAVVFLDNVRQGKMGIVYGMFLNSGELVGVISLTPGRDVNRYSAEVGYFVGEHYWNRGYATEALRLVGNFAQFRHGLNPNRSLGPISSCDVKVFSCSPESKECLPLIYGSHKT